MNRPRAGCDYAACTALASTDVDGWQFCTRHLREHRQLHAQDTVRRLELTAAAGHVEGLLLPSLNLTPLLDALTRDQAPTVEAGVA